jgi:phage host-nuclease inhibitor protein Gam
MKKEKTVSGKAKAKMAAAVELATVEAVDAALVQIARCDAEVARLEAEIAETERIAREQRADLIQTFMERAAMGREAVEASAAAHGEWFAEARSLDLPHGRIGWRKVTLIRLPKAVERVIAALRQRKLFDAVAVKETVRKEILETYEDATDDFYIALGEVAK